MADGELPAPARTRCQMADIPSASLTNRQRNNVEQPTEREPQQQSGHQQAHDNGRDELLQAHAVRFVNEANAAPFFPLTPMLNQSNSIPTPDQ